MNENIFKRGDFFRICKKHSYAFDYRYAKNNADWNIVKALYDNFQLSNEIKIPKIIHQIWLGGKLPEPYMALTKSWKRYNPDWEYVLWTDDTIKNIDFINAEAISKTNNPGMKSDIIRYEILNKYGGLYVDTDFECIKPFEELNKLSFYAGLVFNKNVEVAIGLIGSVPGHGIISDCINNIKYTGEKDWVDIFNTTGSWFFTKHFINNVNVQTRDIVAFPSVYFYPLPNTKRSLDLTGFGVNHKSKIKKHLTDFSYAIHWWHVSWKFW